MSKRKIGDILEQELSVDIVVVNVGDLDNDPRDLCKQDPYRLFI